jgi:hypothetical protein
MIFLSQSLLQRPAWLNLALAAPGSGSIRPNCPPESPKPSISGYE